MKNEIDLREPRTIDYDGRRSGFPIFGTDTGWHSTDKRKRHSDIEILGEGTNLYFKFLKYFMVLFFFCLIFALPLLGLFLSGGKFNGVDNILQQYLGMYSLGNLGLSMDMTCASTSLPDTYNQAAYISFKCPKGMKISNL
jgi:hypothetical protein